MNHKIVDLLASRLSETIPKHPLEEKIGSDRQQVLTILALAMINGEPDFLKGESILITRSSGMGFFPKEMSVKDLFTNL